MYKSRFKTWGLTKHLKTQEVEQLCTEAMHGRPLKPPSIRGRSIGSKRFKRYLDQVNLYTSGQAPPPVFHVGNPPLPGRMQPPDSLKFSEDCMHAVASVARRGLETDAFNFVGVEYDWMGDISLGFLNNMNLATDQLIGKKDLPEAFRMLHKCYDDFALVLERGDPSMTWSSLMSILVLATAGYDLAASFVRYAAGLCAIKLGRHAPLTLLFTRIQTMGISHSRQAAFPIMSAYLNAMKSNNRVGEEFRRVLHIHVVRGLNRRGALSFASASASYKKTLRDFAACQDTKNDVDWYYWAQLEHLALLCDNGKFAEALAGLDEVRSHLHGAGEEFDFEAVISLDPVTAMGYYELKARALEGSGRMDDATAYFVGAYELTVMVASDHMYRITKTVSALEAHYRRKNDPEAADKFRAEAAESWDRLVETKIDWYNATTACCSATQASDHEELCSRQGLPVEEGSKRRITSDESDSTATSSPRAWHAAEGSLVDDDDDDDSDVFFDAMDADEP